MGRYRKISFGSLDFQILLVLGPLQKLLLPFIFCGSNIPDNNSKLVLYYEKMLPKHNCPKNLDGKNHYHPRILTNIQKVGSSRISFSFFLLIRFWILVRNELGDFKKVLASLWSTRLEVRPLICLAFHFFQDCDTQKTSPCWPRADPSPFLAQVLGMYF
jgi:hypothetical protein